MEKLIHKYLTRDYEIRTSDIGNDGIYWIHDPRRHKAPINHEKLLKELNTVFTVSDVESIEHITKWAISIKQDVDLEFYWKEVEDFLLPLAMKVASQTIGRDLVSVQPIELPKGLIMFLDHRNPHEINYELDEE